MAILSHWFCLLVELHREGSVSEACTAGLFIWFNIREGPASQPQSTLSRWKKTPTVNKKFWPPLSLVPKKTVAIIAFRIAWTLDVNILWFVCQVAVCVQKGPKMQFLGVVGFKSSTLTVYCFSSWFIHQQRKTYSNLCVLCWLIHLSWFQGPRYIPASFWPRVTNHDVKSKISKRWFLRSLLFYTTVSWCWKVEQKT